MDTEVILEKEKLGGSFNLCINSALTAESRFARAPSLAREHCQHGRLVGCYRSIDGMQEAPETV